MPVVKKLTILFCLSLFAACHSDQKELRRALAAAGENRQQLEQVIEYYKHDEADSLKLRAAVYLIRYMPLHKSYDTAIEKLYDRIDSLIPNCKKNADSLAGAISLLYDRFKPSLNTLFDIRTVTADYLIRNIEQAFDLWQTKPWAAHLEFGDFCEYLLPHKCIDLQPLTDWRTELADLYDGELGMHTNEEWSRNPRIAATDVNTALHRIKRSYSAHANPCPIFRATTLTNLPRGTCAETSIAVAQIMRSKGIPVSIDFTPQWGARPLSHYWMTVLNHRHQNEVFSAYQSNPGEPHFINRPLDKVFRITYRPNEEMLDILVRDGRLPGSLQNIFVEDVTESYTRVDDLSLEIPKRQTGNKTVYLSVFDNQEWIPVYWGKRSDRRRVRFERMGRDIVYLPVVYGDSERPIPVDDPFFVHPDGRVERLRADTSRLRNIRISRKYPIYELVYKQAVKLRGGKIEAADNPQFRNAETVLRFPEERVVMAGTDSVQSRKPYRYWRFCSSHEGRCDMAELIFYTGDERLQGKLVTCGKEVNPKAKVQIAPAIHDDDALTFFCAQGNDYWVGFDFGKPVDISKILWFRRGDGNDIYPDYEYTLYYWGDRCWQAIGHQKAGSQTWLDFPNVPQNALLLLVCDTKGTQSRPFAYRNGEIEWY